MMENSSFHFIPLNRSKYFDKINSLETDFLVFDLEDSVSNSEKQIARDNLKYLILNRLIEKPFFIRINVESLDDFFLDIQLIKSLSIVNVTVPKISEKILYHLKNEFNSEVTYFLLFEDFQAIGNFNYLISILSNVKFVGLGMEDLLSSIPYPESDIFMFINSIKSDFVLKAKYSNLQVIDSVFVGKNSDQFKKYCLNSKSLGFDGAFSIFPYQVDIINNVWRISFEEYRNSKKIISLIENSSNSSYVVKDEVILSQPKINKANLIIKRYEKT